MKIQIISIVGSLVLNLFVLELIRRKKLKEAYALIWLAMSLLFLLLAAWLQGLVLLSKLIGIQYPPATLFLLLLLTVIIILIQFSVIISKQSDKIKLMAQEVALLKQHVTENSSQANRVGVKVDAIFNEHKTSEQGASTEYATTKEIVEKE